MKIHNLISKCAVLAVCGLAVLTFMTSCTGSHVKTNPATETSQGTTEYPVTGRLTVHPTPSDAHVRILGIKSAYRDGMELPSGHYQIQVSKKRYQTKTVSRTLSAGQALDVEIMLKEIPPPTVAHLTVHPTPADARVRIMNITPPYADGMALAPGSYQIRVDKAGYETVEQWESLAAGQDRDVYIAMTPLPPSQAGPAEQAVGQAVEQAAEQAAEQARVAAAWAKATAVKAASRSQAARKAASLARDVASRARAAGTKWRRSIDGVAIWSNSSGRNYAGEFQNGAFKGVGVFTWPGGTIYEGEWENDKINGLGVKTEHGRDRYEGEWENEKASGLGVCTWPDGKIYEGEWKDDKYNGVGVFTFPDGVVVFAGEFFPDGAVYAGEWKENTFNGFGVLSSGRRGVRYEGEWKNGQKNGLGVKINPDGTRYEWKE